MKDKKALLKASLLLIITLYSCDSVDRKQNTINFLFSSQWDSLRVYTEDSCHELELIINSRMQLENKYEFFLNNQAIIIKHEDFNDTVMYSWNEETRRIFFDSLNLLKLFRKEIMIRKFFVEQSMKANQPTKAWMWLNYPDRLPIDSLYGTFFKKMYYAVDTDEFGDAIPKIERAWAKGHQDSGLSLSFWYTLTGNRDKAIDILKHLATLSNAEAMIELGDLYETYYKDFGYDPPSDANIESSFNWYKKAAALNNSFAMYRLGNIYEKGINKSINIDSAIYWYRKSSSLGESHASSAIGMLFLEGDYIKENVDSGMLWFNKAIIQNPASGYMNLGEIYEKGIVIDADIELAVKFYLKADSAGSPVAMRAVKRLRNKLARPEISI